MRHPKKVTSDDGKARALMKWTPTVRGTEDSFQGLVFKLANEKFKRLTGSCPGVADSFSHNLSFKLGTDCLPYPTHRSGRARNANRSCRSANFQSRTGVMGGD